MNEAIQLKNKNGGKMFPLPYFPIGAVYISTKDINPSTYFGGTWQRIAKGRTLVGIDEDDTDFNTTKKTGGEKTHKLTVEEMPSHTHGTGINESDGFEVHITDATITPDTRYMTNGSSYIRHTLPSRTGGDQPHNNLQPYLTVYIYEKIA